MAGPRDGRDLRTSSSIVTDAGSVSPATSRASRPDPHRGRLGRVLGMVTEARRRWFSEADTGGFAMSRSIVLASLLGALACGANMSPALPGDAHQQTNVPKTGDVQITIASIRIPGADSLVITIANRSAAPLFFTRCGSGPTMLMEQFVDGAWTNAVQNFACLAPSAPGPVELDPGASVSLTRELTLPGRFRYVVFGSDSSTLTATTLFVSDAIDVSTP